MLVKDVMSERTISVDPDDSLPAAARKMRDYDIGCVLVEHHGHLSGILTDRDIACRGFFTGLAATDLVVRDVMTRPVIQCLPTADIETALHLMETNRIRRLPVTDADGHLLGMLSVSDVFTHVPHERSGSLVARLSTPESPPPTLASLR